VVPASKKLCGAQSCLVFRVGLISHTNENQRTMMPQPTRVSLPKMKTPGD
jgi:hypothetical protein